MPQDIYLDNSTTSRPSPQAVSRMLPFFSELWGLPTQPHRMGQELMGPMEEAYRSIYALIGAKEEDDVIMTSSGAEACNHVIASVYQDITLPTGKNHFLVSHTDEAPSLMAVGRLEQMGCMGKMLEPLQGGIVTKELVAEALTPRTALVSLSWADGLTGIIQPVQEIAALCQERGVLLHLDATHVIGKLFYDLEEIGAHFISFNGDQIHAPKGTGGLYIRRGVKLSPLIVGGLEQNGKRAGTFNVPGLIALGAAAKEALEARDYVGTEVARLRNHLEQGITEAVKEAVVLFHQQERLPHCTTIAFPGVASEALLYLLNRRKLYASIGGGSFQQIGLILVSCGVPEELALSAISFSLSRETEEEEIEKAIQIIVESVKQLRNLSYAFVPLKLN